MVLSATDLRSLNYRKTQTLSIEGVGDVCIRSLTSADKSVIEKIITSDPDQAKAIARDGKFREKIAAMALFDPDSGTAPFSPDKAEDLKLLASWDTEMLETIVKEAMKLSGMAASTTEKND